MATLSELFSLTVDAEWSTFHAKIAAACLIKAYNISEEASPSANALSWAKECVANPKSKANEIANYVIAANSGASSSAIFGATDNAIQTNVNTAVDNIYGV